MTDTKEDKELQELKENTKKKLDNLILEKFPHKILELNKLIDETFDVRKVMSITSESNIPIPESVNSGQPSNPSSNINTGLDKRVFLFPNGLNPTNDYLLKLSQCVKPLLLDFVTDMRSVEYAIQLMIPRVEDGNNFGVAIQENVIKKCSHAEHTARGRLAQFSRYYNYRGNIICWIARWPHCDDYRRCLLEEDQKFYLILCLMIRELRDDYISINDLIVKNLDKIKNPRPVRDVNMY